MLDISRRDDEKATREVVARVPNSMSHSARHEYESARAQWKLAIPEQERCLPLGDEERLIGVRVEMKRRTRLARGNRKDFDYVRSVHLRRAEAKIPGAFAGGDHDASVDRFHGKNLTFVAQEWHENDGT